jgi:hypothetical protein
MPKTPPWRGCVTDAEAAEMTILLSDYGEPGSPARAAALLAYATARAMNHSHEEALRNARLFARREGAYNQAEKRIRHQRTRRNTR